MKDLPPKASPMHCSPIQTPNKGTTGPSSKTVCNDIPESWGVPIQGKCSVYWSRPCVSKNNTLAQVLTWSWGYKHPSWIFPVKTSEKGMNAVRLLKYHHPKMLTHHMQELEKGKFLTTKIMKSYFFNSSTLSSSFR